MAGERRETIYGDISADFVEDRLRDLCEPEVGIQTGPFGSQLHQEDYVAIGTPIVTVEHLGENRILHEGVPRVSDADRNRLSRYLLRTGDIVFSRVGAVDRRALVRPAEDGWMFSCRCLRVRPNPEKIDSGYLSYFFGLPAFKEHIRAIAVGATMPSLNTSLLSDVVVPYPKEIAEQLAIAHILGTLDDKIELNQRMSETLEAMARAVFRAWFVDFEPVHAKLEGCRQRGQPLPGLPAHLYDLFTDRLMESELGEIPEWWEVGTLGEVLAQRVDRCRPSDETRSRPYLPIECIAARSLLLAEGKPGEEAQSSLTKFRKGELLFGAMRPYFHKVAIAPFDGTTRMTVFVLRPHKEEDFAFAVLLLHDPATIEYASNHSTGSTIPYAVWQGSLEVMPIVLPLPEVRASFNRVVRPLLDQIPPMFFANRTLASL